MAAENAALPPSWEKSSLHFIYFILYSYFTKCTILQIK